MTPRLWYRHRVDSKRCPNCDETKPIADFGFKNRELQLRQSWCKACERVYKQGWYLRNRERHMANVYATKVRVRSANRLRVLAYLVDHACIDCGEGNLVVLDFDHVRSKRWNIAYMVSRGFPWATIEDEIARCEVRCANCHRIKTAREQGYYERKSNGLLFEAPGEYRVVTDNWPRAVSSADRALAF